MLGANLTGKEVVVNAGGVNYRGRLVEIADTHILLKMEGGFMEIPMSSVHEIVPAKVGAQSNSSRLPPSPLAGAKKGA